MKGCIGEKGLKKFFFFFQGGSSLADVKAFFYDFCSRK